MISLELGLRGTLLYLLITNCKLSLCLLIVLSEFLQVFNWFALRDRNGKRDVGFGVLMSRLRIVSLDYSRYAIKTYIDYRIIWDRNKGLVQCSIHLLCCTFEKSSASYMIKNCQQKSNVGYHDLPP